jgi:hypothetical protein
MTSHQADSVSQMCWQVLSARTQEGSEAHFNAVARLCHHPQRGSERVRSWFRMKCEQGGDQESVVFLPIAKPALRGHKRKHYRQTSEPEPFVERSTKQGERRTVFALCQALEMLNQAIAVCLGLSHLFIPLQTGSDTRDPLKPASFA